MQVVTATLNRGLAHFIQCRLLFYLILSPTSIPISNFRFTSSLDLINPTEQELFVQYAI